MRIPGIVLISIVFLASCGQVDKPTISLYLAMQRGDLDQIERHIHWEANLNQPLPNGKLPLQMAAGMGRPIITKLLIKDGANLSAKDHEGKTALYRALESGRTQIADILLKSGAKLDPTAMLQDLVQAQVTDRDMLAFLIDRGAEINAVGKDGKTPLTQAIGYGNLLLTKQLIRAGADVNKADAQGNRPLKIATERNNPDIIRSLRRNGATTE